MNNSVPVTQFLNVKSSRGRAGFSLVEVVVAVGIFAVAILSIVALLLPNTKAVADQIDAGVAQRLSENIQLELDRYGFTRVVAALPNQSARLFMVATKDGSRVLVTGEDPYAAWADTYNKYKPDAATNYKTVPPLQRLAAENNLSTDTVPGNPPGIAFRDRFFLVEISWPDVCPQYTANSGVMPLSVRMLWPYRLPNGPDAPTVSSKYDSQLELPWMVVAPSSHSTLLLNVALKP
jgi:type II secretory pathway pseudopilin PulG